MDIEKVQQYNPFLYPANTGAFGSQKVNPQAQPTHEPTGFGAVGGINGGVPYNAKIQPVNYAEITQGINKDPRNSGLQEGALGENALYVNGGRAGGQLNLLF